MREDIPNARAIKDDPTTWKRARGETVYASIRCLKRPGEACEAQLLVRRSIPRAVWFWKLAVVSLRGMKSVPVFRLR